MSDTVAAILMPPATQRIAGVDIVRLAAIVAVICIHTTPFGAAADVGFSVLQPGWLINQACRFAVPFFFIMSGYFWAGKLQDGIADPAVSLAMAKRILIIFVAWSLIYLLPSDIGAIDEMGLAGPFKVAYWNLSSLRNDPWRILLEGTKSHLWFLVAILWALGIATLFLVHKRLTALVALAVALYIAGMLMKAYVDTPFGLPTAFQSRNGPFFGTLPFVTGILFAKLRRTPDWFWTGAQLFLCGLLIQGAETAMLWKLYGTSPIQDYTIGTYFMGCGAAMFALSNHATLHNAGLSGLGKYSLGIYAGHIIFVDIFKHVDKHTDNPWWQVGNVLVVFVCSLLLAAAFGRNKVLSKIVL